MDEASVIGREGGLHQSLSRAQVVMISLGGSIGTTLFLSSGIALGYAGPAVLVSYAIAGFVAAAMVFSLSEMAVAHPIAGSIGVYAELYLNRWAGFVVRYTYWFAQVIATGFEAVAAGIYMTFWFPGSPVWLWSSALALIVVLVNSRSVKSFGTAEYWFSLIKVTAIVLFIGLGAAHIFGIGFKPIGVGNLYRLPGGFFPRGLGGVWMAVILGLLSFVGIEVIAVTSGEVRDPETTIPAALRTMAVRLFLFYVLALAVVAALIPWTETGGSVAVAQSPFVTVLGLTGIPYAADIMNFVIISAAFSGMNTNVYLCSRMLFSLSRGGYGPRRLGRLSSTGAPVAAVYFSGAFVLLATGLARFTPRAYAYLQGVALFGAVIVWMLILVSHLRFRQVHPVATLRVRTPFFPYMQIAGLAILGAVLVTMGLDKDWNVSWMVGVPWLGVVSIVYVVWKRVAGVDRQPPEAALAGAPAAAGPPPRSPSP